MHRILYVCTPEPDYGQDMVYAGLVEVLGAANVRETPFHLGYHWHKKAYPRDLGYVPGTLPGRLLRTLTRFEPTAVVIASCKPRCVQHYLKLLPSLPKDVPHIFIDGGDRPELGGDLDRLGAPHLWQEVLDKHPFDLILKREKLLAATYAPEVIAFPYGVQADRLPAVPVNRRYDVTFWAVESDPIRTKALGLLEDRYDCRANGTVRGQTFRSYARKGARYLAELAASKLVLNLRGVGHDTLRYWEAPALQTAMVSTRPPIEIPDNFVDGEHVYFVRDDLSDLVHVLDHWLSHEDAREALAARARAYALAHHTHTHRARRLLALLSEV